jgi:exodeoxyribonuclease-5
VFVADDVFWPQDLVLRRQLAYVAVSRAQEAVWMAGRSSSAEAVERWSQALNQEQQ